MTAGRRPSDTATMPTNHTRTQVAILQLLTALFICRVLVQLIQYTIDVDALPEFERWQSGALPYGVLVVLQLSIVAGQAVIIRPPRPASACCPIACCCR